MRVQCLHSSTTPCTFSPNQVLTAFNPDSSFELSAGTSDFHYCIQGENETHFHTKVCPGGYTAFIYKARRTLLFRSPSFLLFCSHTRIVVLWRGESLVQPMSTATGIGQHSNISHSLFADCRTEVLSLDLLCCSQTHWPLCSPAMPTTTSGKQLLEGHWWRCAAATSPSEFCREQISRQLAGK